MSIKLTCMLCNKEYLDSGIGYHIKIKHNMKVKDYLKQYYNIPYSSVEFREITFKDIETILNSRLDYPNFNSDLERFQFLYDKYNDLRKLDKNTYINAGKICMCLGVNTNRNLSNEHKEKISKARKGKPLSEYHRFKISNGLYNQQNKENRYNNLSQKLKGHRHTKESIEKMILKRPQTHTFRGKGGIREDIGHFVRSTWEANYARILRYLNIDYKYEPEVIWLTREDGSVISYTPDFKIKDVYIEIKGYMREDARDKLELLKQQYPNIKVKIIDASIYNILQKTYKNKIERWE